jgi:plasmid maintenance system antidote protein VapI
MTSGSVDLNRTPLSRYTKTWNGTNYPGTPPSDLFQAVWKKVERETDDTWGPPREKYSYLRVWEKRNQKRRSVNQDHPYAMSMTFWVDPTSMLWDQSLPLDPGRVERYFHAVYDSGYSGNFDDAWTGNDGIALQGKLREKIVGSDFDMSVFLGEGRKTLKLISDSATRLHEAYLGLRHFDVAKMARALGSNPARVSEIMHRNRRMDLPITVKVSQAWLELQYGWMPLVRDAYGAAQALAQQLNEPAVQTYRVRMKKPIVATPVSSNISSWSYWGEVRAQLIARLREINVAALNGLRDPSSVLWELLPWSFVADWFIPIGNYLSARGLAQAVSGTFTTSIHRREMFESQSGIPKNPFVSPVRQPDFRQMRVRLDRTVSSSLTTPRPQFKTLSEVPSWRRAANATALLLTNAGLSGASSMDTRLFSQRVNRRRWRGGSHGQLE